MDQLSQLIPIEQYVFTETFSPYILSYYHPCFLRSPCALLTYLNLIRSTRQTGAFVSLRRTWPNHHMQFSLIFSFKEVTLILVRIFKSCTCCSNLDCAHHSNNNDWCENSPIIVSSLSNSNIIQYRCGLYIYYYHW